MSLRQNSENVEKKNFFISLIFGLNLEGNFSPTYLNYWTNFKSQARINIIYKFDKIYVNNYYNHLNYESFL